MSETNRRSFLSSLVGLVVGGAVGGLVAKETKATPREHVLRIQANDSHILSVFGASSWRVAAARQITNESGEMWLAACERRLGRNPILIAFDDDRAVEVTRGHNGWKLAERYLATDESAGRNECRRDHRLAFYSYTDRTTATCSLPLPQIGQPIDGQPYWLRAWIKNGRRPEWQMSIGGYNKPITL